MFDFIGGGFIGLALMGCTYLFFAAASMGYHFGKFLLTEWHIKRMAEWDNEFHACGCEELMSDDE